MKFGFIEGNLVGIKCNIHTCWEYEYCPKQGVIVYIDSNLDLYTVEICFPGSKIVCTKPVDCLYKIAYNKEEFDAAFNSFYEL